MDGALPCQAITAAGQGWAIRIGARGSVVAVVARSLQGGLGGALSHRRLERIGPWIGGGVGVGRKGAVNRLAEELASKDQILSESASRCENQLAELARQRTEAAELLKQADKYRQSIDAAMKKNGLNHFPPSWELVGCIAVLASHVPMFFPVSLRQQHFYFLVQ